MRKSVQARQLIDEFTRRTGLIGSSGDPSRRYLWTDAFAVQTCFGLSRALRDPSYRDLAVHLIDEVHDKLGRYHPKDARKGWISGLSDEDAARHPTAAGLRIGKKLPERALHDLYDDDEEWDRDGQYFHYLTRWFHALMQAHRETADAKYATWAAELIIAGGRFIAVDGSAPHMYWKMNTDLTRPAVRSMGHHDPLEGLLCALTAHAAVPGLAAKLNPLIEAFTRMVAGKTWATSDALGVGGIALNVVRAMHLAAGGVRLPPAASPAKLFAETKDSLSVYRRTDRRPSSAERRLAFRELGLALGVRVLDGLQRDPSPPPEAAVAEIGAFVPLAEELEAYWLDPAHQRATTWGDHLDINAVTLAASLLAADEPGVFG